ncbi:hypothetical protein CASFOL_014660 [Castilleja foliolosa]|uniref:Uncharacterized protein n=1 Tax=Castilleja foliolosa TaxID=1961234 RepID=A0ABD3DFL7_9LAMI
METNKLLAHQTPLGTDVNMQYLNPDWSATENGLPEPVQMETDAKEVHDYIDLQWSVSTSAIPGTIQNPLIKLRGK